MSRWRETPYNFRAEIRDAENDAPPGRWIAGDYVDLNDIPDLSEADYR